MNICKSFSWQDDCLVTIWDSKILLGCNRVTRHCWFWAAIQILRFTEHSSYGHWLKEKTRENQNGKMNLFLFSPCLRNIPTFYLNKCFLSHFHLSLLSLCCLPVANIDPISIAVEDQSLDVQIHKGKFAWFGCPDTQSDLQLISCIAPAYRVSGNILVLGCPVSGL